MTLVERIQQYVQRLPISFQTEALDFVEYLLFPDCQQAASAITIQLTSAFTDSGETGDRLARL